MIDTFRTLSAALLLALLLSSAAMADEALDLQVEIGVKAYDDGDYERAKEILLPLAEAEHPKAINLIGLMHRYGRGFAAAPITACDLYEQSATRGYPSAMLNLSRCYERGVGRPIDTDMAHQWMLRAADNGVILAMIRLSDHERSTVEERRRWLQKAVISGNRYAAALLWNEGHKEDAPDFTLRDEICVLIRILVLHQGVLACDE